MRTLFGIASCVLALALPAPPALACACCSDRASRYVEVEKMSERRLGEIERMEFAEEAHLLVTEGDPNPLTANDLGTQLRLAVARSRKEMAFWFRDPLGRTGALTLAMPKTISIFEVDPRGGEKDEGLGPSLYKEWKLTAKAAGGGAFRPLLGGRQQLTLILHGRGRGCTDVTHFTDWTLLIHGPVGKLSLYGTHTSGGR